MNSMLIGVTTAPQGIWGTAKSYFQTAQLRIRNRSLLESVTQIATHPPQRSRNTRRSVTLSVLTPQQSSFTDDGTRLVHAKNPPTEHETIHTSRTVDEKKKLVHLKKPPNNNNKTPTETETVHGDPNAKPRYWTSTRKSSTTPVVRQANGQGKNKKLCFATLRYWAEVALLNDSSEEQIVDFFAQAHAGDYLEVHAYDIGDFGQRIFVMVNHTTKRQTVSIRGTKNLITLLTNFKARPTEFLQGAKVHQGYLKVAQGLQKWITPHLRQDYALCLTGHSAGGTLSVILAMHYDAAGYQIGSVVTFGAPKVGTYGVKEACAHLPIVRVAEKNDLIPLLPPTTWKTKTKTKKTKTERQAGDENEIPDSRAADRPVWEHVGRTVLISEDLPTCYACATGRDASASASTYHPSAEHKSTVPSIVVYFLRSNWQRLKSHKMVRYASTLGVLVENAREISAVKMLGDVPESHRVANLLQDVESLNSSASGPVGVNPSINSVVNIPIKGGNFFPINTASITNNESGDTNGSRALSLSGANKGVSSKVGFRVSSLRRLRSLRSVVAISSWRRRRRIAKPLQVEIPKSSSSGPVSAIPPINGVVNPPSNDVLSSPINTASITNNESGDNNESRALSLSGANDGVSSRVGFRVSSLRRLRGLRSVVAASSQRIRPRFTITKVGLRKRTAKIDRTQIDVTPKK